MLQIRGFPICPFFRTRVSIYSFHPSFTLPFTIYNFHPHIPCLSFSPHLQTLRVIRIADRARIRAHTGRRTTIPNTPTLPVLRHSPARRPSSRSRAARRARRRGACPSASSSARSRKLSIHKSEGGLPVLSAVALMRGGVGAVAAVGVRGVAVGLDFGGRGADEACWAGGELGVR